MKVHPQSPVQQSEIKLDATRRHFVVRDGTAYRIRTRVVEVKPRKFQRMIELREPIGPAHLVIL